MIKLVNSYPVSQLFGIDAGVVYKSGFKLNAELATAEVWSVEQNDARTTAKLKQVVSLFAITEGHPCA